MYGNKREKNYTWTPAKWRDVPRTEEAGLDSSPCLIDVCNRLHHLTFECFDAFLLSRSSVKARNNLCTNYVRFDRFIYLHADFLKLN